MAKKAKMRNISKRADRRALVSEGEREFGSRATTVHIQRVLFMLDSLSLVWGHSVHFAKFPILQFLKLLFSQFLSDFIQTLYNVS